MSWDHGYCMCGAIDCPWCGPAQGYDPDIDLPEDEYNPEENDNETESR